MSDAVRLEREESGLAVVTFDSPPVNLFDERLGEGLRQAVAELVADVPRAVLFRAEGGVFTGGVDVNEFAAISTPAEAEEMFALLLDITDQVERLSCPTVLAAHALCLTWGFELALACDLLLAAEGAQFGLVESRVGLTPGAGGTQRLAERAGTGRAREFVMTGGLFDARTLAGWGVVNRVYADAEFAERARRVAERLAAGPTKAHAATKEILRAYLEGGVDGANAVTARVAGALWETEDLPQAVQSFLKDGPGKASFSGR